MEALTKEIYQEVFGYLEQQEIYLFTLRNQQGNTVKITNYGGIITSWLAIDKDGHQRDIVLGFDNLESYLEPHPYLGVIAGRYANRIAHGTFHIDEILFSLSQNEGQHHLHGGHKGFDKVVWSPTIEGESLVLSYNSADGEEGYPGNLQVQVRYSFDNDNQLSIQYAATTDKATPVNLTSHSYFNLTGDASNNILSHSLTIDANHYLPVSEAGIPTGEIRPVENTDFDFRRKRMVRNSENNFCSYDHNFVLNEPHSISQPIALLSEPMSGFRLKVFTTEPGIQVYAGIHLDGSCTNKDGHKISKYAGICLETQQFPNAPNQKEFPDTILFPGNTYQSNTIYKLTICKD